MTSLIPQLQQPPMSRSPSRYRMGSRSRWRRAVGRGMVSGAVRSCAARHCKSTMKYLSAASQSTALTARLALCRNSQTGSLCDSRSILCVSCTQGTCGPTILSIRQATLTTSVHMSAGSCCLPFSKLDRSALLFVHTRVLASPVALSLLKMMMI